MPVRFLRYVPDNASFGEFMVSDGVGKVAEEAAGDLEVLARGFSPQAPRTGGDHYINHFGHRQAGIVTIAGNPRRFAEVYNDADWASGVEFGEVPTRKLRPQGGSRGAPSRPLGRAGATFGDYSGGLPA